MLETTFFLMQEEEWRALAKAVYDDDKVPWKSFVDKCRPNLTAAGIPGGAFLEPYSQDILFAARNGVLPPALPYLLVLGVNERVGAAQMCVDWCQLQLEYRAHGPHTLGRRPARGRFKYVEHRGVSVVEPVDTRSACYLWHDVQAVDRVREAVANIDEDQLSGCLPGIWATVTRAPDVDDESVQEVDPSFRKAAGGSTRRRVARVYTRMVLVAVLTSLMCLGAWAYILTTMEVNMLTIIMGGLTFVYLMVDGVARFKAATTWGDATLPGTGITLEQYWCAGGSLVRGHACAFTASVNYGLHVGPLKLAQLPESMRAGNYLFRSDGATLFVLGNVTTVGCAHTLNPGLYAAMPALSGLVGDDAEPGEIPPNVPRDTFVVDRRRGLVYRLVGDEIAGVARTRDHAVEPGEVTPAPRVLPPRVALISTDIRGKCVIITARLLVELGSVAGALGAYAALVSSQGLVDVATVTWACLRVYPRALALYAAWLGFKRVSEGRSVLASFGVWLSADNDEDDVEALRDVLNVNGPDEGNVQLFAQAVRHGLRLFCVNNCMQLSGEAVTQLRTTGCRWSDVLPGQPGFFFEDGEGVKFIVQRPGRIISMTGPVFHAVDLGDVLAGGESTSAIQAALGGRLKSPGQFLIGRGGEPKLQHWERWTVLGYRHILQPPATQPDTRVSSASCQRCGMECLAVCFGVGLGHGPEGAVRPILGRWINEGVGCKERAKTLDHDSCLKLVWKQHCLRQSSEEGQLCTMDMKHYRSGVGQMLNLVKLSRPDIVSAVCEQSKVMYGSAGDHLKALMRVISYVVDAKALSLSLKPTKHEGRLIAYSDSNHVSDKDGCHSVSGFDVFYESALVSWKSKMQQYVTLSSKVAEYIACSQSVAELKCVRQVAESIGMKITLPERGRSRLVSEKGWNSPEDA